MLQWIQHAGNFELVTSAPNFPIAIWICSTQKGDGFSLNIYAGRRLIHAVTFKSFAEAEASANQWLDNLAQEILTLTKTENSN